MKFHLTLAILLLQFSVQLFSQPIRGVVLDENSGDPIDYAAVYVDGTFIGSTTNSEGEFSVDMKTYQDHPLMISAMGYQSYSLDHPSPDKYYKILLERRVFEIEEISVTKKSLELKRKANLRVFRQEFLGYSNNAKKCQILNEEVISFNYEEGWSDLEAFASAPLEIQNDALGYKLVYYLDHFSYDRVHKTISFSGSIIFTDDLAADNSSLQQFERRRKNTFTGSRQHFFRALWNNDLRKSGFAIERFQFNDQLKYEDVVLEDDQGNRYFTYSEELNIWYNRYRSGVMFLKTLVYFDSSGYFDPDGLQWQGAMSAARIADFLPYEYQLPL